MQVVLYDKDCKEYILKLIKVEDKYEGQRTYNLIDENQDIHLSIVENHNRNGFEILESKMLGWQDQNDFTLSELYVKIIETEQLGTEDTDGVNIESNPYNPDDIKVNQKPFNVTLIHQMIKDKYLNLNPDFQRNFVWETTRKSKLIESILLRIPLPMFYFAEDKEGNVSVVDGLQRLTTIYEFMENKFKLKGLEYLKTNCENKYYKDSVEENIEGIDSKYFRWFNMTQLTVNVIDPSSPSKVKYDIFRRINEGGKPLNNQEIRNCLASPKVRKLLKEMTELEEFKIATDYSIKPSRMEDQDVVLRFIRFKDFYDQGNNFDNYNGNMETTLDDMIEILNNDKSDLNTKYVIPFQTAMKNAEHLFERYAFRKIKEEHIVEGEKKQLINKALFVAWSVILSNYSESEVKASNQRGCLIKPLAENISDKKEFFGYLSYGTNGKLNIQEVFKYCSDVANENLRIIKYE